MIVDIPRFVAAERPYWDELRARSLDRMDAEPERRLPLAEIQRLHYLYERCSAGPRAPRHIFHRARACARLLESLVSRAYSEIHETRAPKKIRWKALRSAFPRAFRRHLGAFRPVAGHHAAGLRFRMVRHPHGPAFQGRADALSRPAPLARRARPQGRERHKPTG